MLNIFGKRKKSAPPAVELGSSGIIDTEFGDELDEFFNSLPGGKEEKSPGVVIAEETEDANYWCTDHKIIYTGFCPMCDLAARRRYHQ